MRCFGLWRKRVLPAVCVLWAALCGRAEDAVKKSESPPAETPGAGEKKPAFEISCWHPDARWRIEKFAGSGLAGHLDGPRREMQMFSVGAVGPSFRPNGAGKYRFAVYDERTERAHMVAGSARGYLDGPFCRARFGGWDYVVRSVSAGSPDGRYSYFTDGYNGHVLRCLDFEKQEVKTLLKDGSGVQGLACRTDGALYILKNAGTLQLLHPDGKLEDCVALKCEEEISRWGVSLALDEKNNRLYATEYGTKKYYIWFWNLKDGSFHGVLPMPEEGKPKRGRNEPGPFEGTDLYGQGSVMFGPDDPERRFLYVGRVDTWCVFRLELEKRVVWAMTAEGKEPDQIARFIDSGKPGHVPFYGGGRILPDGSFVSLVHTPHDCWIFRRIK